MEFDALSHASCVLWPNKWMVSTERNVKFKWEHVPLPPNPSTSPALTPPPSSDPKPIPTTSNSALKLPLVPGNAKTRHTVAEGQSGDTSTKIEDASTWTCDLHGPMNKWATDEQAAADHATTGGPLPDPLENVEGLSLQLPDGCGARVKWPSYYVKRVLAGEGTPTSHTMAGELPKGIPRASIVEVRKDDEDSTHLAMVATISARCHELSIS